MCFFFFIIIVINARVEVESHKTTETGNINNILGEYKIEHLYLSKKKKINPVHPFFVPYVFENHLFP